MKDNQVLARRVQKELLHLRNRMNVCLRVLKEAETAGINPLSKVREVLAIVANEFGIEPEAIIGTSQSKQRCMPRQVAQYLMSSTLGMSYPEIGSATGDRHHTTVMHAVKKLSAMRTASAKFDSKLANLEDKVRFGDWMEEEDSATRKTQRQAEVNGHKRVNETVLGEV